MSQTIESAFRAALVDPTAPVPAGLVSPRGDVDPLRFAVYRNNVHVGLVNALAARFPVVRRLVGADFFTAMARVHVADNKPSSPLMMEYGEGFPDFVGDFSSARTVPYLRDVARLELSWSRAYHAADAQTIKPEDLAALTPDALLEACLHAHPATGLLVSRYAVGSVWSAHQGPQVTRVTARGGEAVLVTRPQSTVTVNVLPARDVVFAEALLGGARIGEAGERALAADGTFDLGSALVGLVSLGAFTGFEEDPRS